jgi:hypothetical protein
MCDRIPAFEPPGNTKEKEIESGWNREFARLHVGGEKLESVYGVIILSTDPFAPSSARVRKGAFTRAGRRNICSPIVEGMQGRTVKSVTNLSNLFTDWIQCANWPGFERQFYNPIGQLLTIVSLPEQVSGPR